MLRIHSCNDNGSGVTMACVVGQNVNSNDSSLYSGNMGIPMVTGHKVNNDIGFYKGLYSTDDQWTVI
jgi:hypothetical protein